MPGVRTSAFSRRRGFVTKKEYYSGSHHSCRLRLLLFCNRGLTVECTVLESHYLHGIGRMGALDVVVLELEQMGHRIALRVPHSELDAFGF